MAKAKESPFDISRIMQMLPHRYPFLLIDRVLEINYDDETLLAIKNVTFNEPQFTGHFPQRPVMPGVLIVEAMAQAAAIYAIDRLGEEAEGKVIYFMSIDNAKFRKPVTPGDSVYFHVKKAHSRGMVWKFDVTSKVEDTKVAEASLTAMIVDEDAKK